MSNKPPGKFEYVKITRLEMAHRKKRKSMMRITTDPGEAFLPELKAAFEALLVAEPTANCLAVLTLLAPVVESCINTAYQAGFADADDSAKQGMDWEETTTGEEE